MLFFGSVHIYLHMIQAFYTPYFKLVPNLCLGFINHNEWMKPEWCAGCLDHKPIDLSGYGDWLSPVYLTTAAFSQLHCSWVFSSLSSPTEETRRSWEGHWLTNELQCTDNGVRLEMVVSSARKRLLIKHCWRTYHAPDSENTKMDLWLSRHSSCPLKLPF